MFRTAIIGVGAMGRRHLQAVRDLGLDLIAICDVSAESLQQASTEHNINADRQFTNALQMLEQTRPDCVIVATTAPTHCEYTCAAAAAGAKVILCEKPMAISLAECDQMNQVCSQYGASLAINHPMRFMEQYTATKNMIQLKDFGDLCSVTVIGGNLGLAMNGTHLFEMFRFLTDEAPAEVTAWLMPEKVSNPRGPEFEDRGGSVRLSTLSGKRLYLELGTDQGHGMVVVVQGSYGRLIIDSFAGIMRLNTREEAFRRFPTTRYNLPSVETEQQFPVTSATDLARRTLEALLTGGPFPTGEQGKQALKVLIAAYMSDENGHTTVQLAETQLPVERKFLWA